MAPHEVKSRRRPSYFEGPISTLVPVGALFSLALFSLGLGFLLPQHRVVPMNNAYEQSGTFSYVGAAKRPTPVYPSGLVATGQPIYPGLVGSVVVSFKYRFTSALPHEIRGTIELRALLLSQSDTWQRLSTIGATVAFTGDDVTISSDVPLNGLFQLINQVSSQAGIAEATYSADVEPVVHITGNVNGKLITQSFAPVLPFTVTTTEISLDTSTAPVTPGATYVPPSVETEMMATIYPEQAGSIPHIVANEISVAKYEISVPELRVLGAVLGVLGIISAGAHDILRRRMTRCSDEDSIAKRLHSIIVPVVSLAQPTEPAPIEVSDFAHLAGLAQFLERPILYEMNSPNRTYAVDDDHRRYVFRKMPYGTQGVFQATMTSDQDTDLGSTPSGPRPRVWLASSTLVRAGAGMIVLAVGLTMVTSFTASTQVPASSAGVLIFPGEVSEGTPPGCESLALTSLVIGSGTFSNSTSHSLVLGSAGKDTITDTGQDNCLVGGGGRDVVTGTSSDICIIGPTSGAAYSRCKTAT
jgi:hypothetical protein